MSLPLFPLVNGATLVTREQFLPQLTRGEVQSIVAVTYLKADEYSDIDKDCEWKFVKVSDTAGFVYPETDKPLKLATAFGEVVEVDKISFGLICCYIGYNHLSWAMKAQGKHEQAQVMNELFFDLRNWVWGDDTESQVSQAVGKETKEQLFSNIFRITD